MSEPAEPVQSTKRCYKKVQINMPFIVDNKVMQFQALDGNVGVLCLTTGVDDAAIAALDKAADAKRGGIVKITEQQLEELKKKLPLTPFAPKRKPMLQLWQNQPPKLKPKLPVAPVANAVVASKTSAPGVGSQAVGGGTVAVSSAAVPAPSVARRSGGPVLRKPVSGKFRSDSGVAPEQ